MSRLFYITSIPITAAGIAGSFVIVPHTFGLEKTKNFLHLYK